MGRNPRSVIFLSSIALCSSAVVDQACTQRLNRLKLVGQQGNSLMPDKAIAKSDMLFPENEQSAPDDHSSWGNMEELAANLGGPFSSATIFDGKPKAKDVVGGRLTDGYLLAAFAGIAHTNPEQIEDIFIRRDLWEKGIYTTRWHLGGMVVDVAVNDKFPLDGLTPLYASPPLDSSEEKKVFWPALLEKAWSKLFGGYGQPEKGSWSEVVAAISPGRIESWTHGFAHPQDLQAKSHGWIEEDPDKTCFELHVDYSGADISMSTASTVRECQLHCQANEECTHFTYWDTKCVMKRSGWNRAPSQEKISGPRDCSVAMDNLWNDLVNAVDKSWPIGAEHKSSTTGAVSTYSVLQTDGYSRVAGRVQVLNSTRMKLSNETHDERAEAQSMPFDEYWKYFGRTQIARFCQKCGTTSLSIPLQNGAVTGVYEFSFEGDGDLTVGLQWPSPVLISPCELIAPAAQLVVTDRHATTSNELAFMDPGLRPNQESMVTAVVDLGAVKYFAYINVNFGSPGTWVENILLTVYSSHAVRIFKSKTSLTPEHFRKRAILPECHEDMVTVVGQDFEWNGLYQKSNETLHDVNLYISTDGSHRLFWDKAVQQWEFIETDRYEQIKAGTRFWDTPRFKREDLVCGTMDYTDEFPVKKFPGLTCDKVRAKTYRNVRCGQGTELDILVGRYCPATCQMEQAVEVAVKNDTTFILPCGGEPGIYARNVTVNGIGRYIDGFYMESTLPKLGEVPVYESIDGNTVMYFRRACEGWTFIGANQMSKVREGHHFNTPCYRKNELNLPNWEHQCTQTQTDIGEIHPYLLPCEAVTPGSEKFSNFHCGQTVVQRYCAETCKDQIELSRLFSTSEVVQAGASAPSWLIAGSSLAAFALVAAALATKRRSWLSRETAVSPAVLLTQEDEA